MNSPEYTVKKPSAVSNKTVNAVCENNRLMRIGWVKRGGRGRCITRGGAPIYRSG